MTVSEKHTCPQCGAPLDQHLFVQTCSFCGYVSAAIEQPKTELALEEPSPQDRYDYIISHLTYIQSECPVEVKQRDKTYCIRANHSFSPKNGKSILKTLPLRYMASFAEESFRLLLSLEAEVDVRPQLYFKVDENSIVVPLIIQKQQRYSFQLTFNQFAALCEAEELVVDTNMTPLEYSWDEFKTYSRRYYHSVFDRTKYRYSLNQKLIIDK